MREAAAQVRTVGGRSCGWMDLMDAGMLLDQPTA